MKRIEQAVALTSEYSHQIAVGVDLLLEKKDDLLLLESKRNATIHKK